MTASQGPGADALPQGCPNASLHEIARHKEATASRGAFLRVKISTSFVCLGKDTLASNGPGHRFKGGRANPAYSVMIQLAPPGPCFEIADEPTLARAALHCRVSAPRQPLLGEFGFRLRLRSLNEIAKPPLSGNPQPRTRRFAGRASAGGMAWVAAQSDCYVPFSCPRGNRCQGLG